MLATSGGGGRRPLGAPLLATGRLVLRPLDELNKAILAIRSCALMMNVLGKLATVHLTIFKLDHLSVNL